MIDCVYLYIVRSLDPGQHSKDCQYKHTYNYNQNLWEKSETESLWTKKNYDVWSLRSQQLQSFCSVKIFLSFITPHCQVNMIFLYQALNCFPFKLREEPLWSRLLYDITIFHCLSFLFIVVITCFIVFCLVDLFQIFVTIRISQSCFDETEKGWYVNEKLQGLDASLKTTWTIQILSKSQERTFNLQFKCLGWPAIPLNGLSLGN